MKSNERAVNDITAQEDVVDLIGLAMSKMRRESIETFDSYDKAVEWAEQEGLFVFHRTDAKSIVNCIRHAGGEFRYNPIDNCIEICHQVLTGGNWLEMAKGNNEVAMVSRILHEVGCQITEAMRCKTGRLKDVEEGYALLPLTDRIWGAAGGQNHSRSEVLGRRVRARIYPDRATRSARNSVNCGTSKRPINEEPTRRLQTSRGLKYR